MKRYPGQAIAIIMVVLVVAAVIGASLYSRMIRNKGEVVETRESQMALEQASNVLGAFTTADILLLQNHLGAELADVDPDPIILDGYVAIENFLLEIGDMDLRILDSRTDTSCKEPTVSIAYAELSDEIDYRVGEVMAINIGDVQPPAGCEATLSFETRGSGSHLFTIKRVYRTKATGEVKNYKLDDMLLYCLNVSGSECSGVAPLTSITSTLANGDKINVPLTIPDLHEVRVLPLKEKIGISIVGNEYCGRMLHNYLIKATVSCSGQERTMQLIVPNATNFGYPAIFDYTIYNSSGTLAPYN